MEPPHYREPVRPASTTVADPAPPLPRLHASWCHWRGLLGQEESVARREGAGVESQHYSWVFAAELPEEEARVYYRRMGRANRTLLRGWEALTDVAAAVAADELVAAVAAAELAAGAAAAAAVVPAIDVGDVGAVLAAAVAVVVALAVAQHDAAAVDVESP